MNERVKALESTHGGVVELVGLLNDVKGALRLFVKLGAAVEWCVKIALKIGAPIFAAGYAYNKWRNGA